MTRRAHPNWKNRAAAPKRLPVAVTTKQRFGLVTKTSARGADCGRYGPSLPAEDWYDLPEKANEQYRLVVQQPGEGYRHVVTPQEVRERLSRFPSWMLRPLAVVQLSRMTRRKRTFPCYGMQWGNSVYLYPIEESLTEYYPRPPKPSELQEAAMFGATWQQEEADVWALKWTLPAIRDFYLNNVLIHELGHLLDNRNSSHVDRERFAEWFAIEYGYKPSRAEMARRAARRVVRRHHG